MKKYILLLLISAFVVSCGPSICEECNGSGKISKSKEVESPFEVLSASWDDDGLNFLRAYDEYKMTIIVRNKSDKGGDFNVKAIGIYNEVGGKKEMVKTDFIPAGGAQEFKFLFETKNKPDQFQYKVDAPMIIITDESLCRKCKGLGKI